MDNKKETTKQKIFAVSLRLFVQKGYGSTTIRDIAQAADISTGLLFHYFPNKQALLTAHLELAAQGIATVQEVLSLKRAPIEVFSIIAELTLRSLHDPTQRFLYLLMNQPLPDDAVNSALRQQIRKDGIITATIPLIEKGQRLGEIRSGDPRALAATFWGAIQGVAEVLADQPYSSIPDPRWLIDILKA